MSETQGSGDDSSASSDLVDFVSQDLCSAASFTILIHGVGAETSEELLAAARKGYLASGFDNAFVQTRLPECPALSQEKGAEAILIRGQNSDHYVIALPWNNRARLFFIALCCLIMLLLLLTMTAAASWGGLLGEGLHKSVGGVLASIILLFAKWASPWWIPRLWVFGSLLVLALYSIGSNVIIRCIPNARTAGWKLLLGMLVLAVAFIGLASVRTMWFVREKHPYTANLERPELPDPTIGIDEIRAWRASKSVAAINATTTFGSEATQHAPPVKGPNSSNELDPKIDSVTNSPIAKPNIDQQPVRPQEQASANKIDEEQIQSDSRKRSHTELKVHSDFFTRAVLILICVGGIALTCLFGWILDFGLDVLRYGGDENYNDKMFRRLNNAIRWLHSQAPNAHLTIVAHSLGSVIAAQAISSISDSEPVFSQITLITLGSPLNYLNQVFPNVAKTPRELSDTICSRARWINLWRRSDEIGRELDVEPGVLVQYCIGKGHHLNYWADGAVWKAVVYESLKIGDPPRDPARCFLEVHLRLIAAPAIVLLLIFGITLSYRPSLIYWLPTFAKAVFHYFARH